MKNLILIGLLFCFLPACAEISDLDYQGVSGERRVPKSYEPLTEASIENDIGWRLVDAMNVSGHTLTGRTAEVIGFDASLEMGQFLQLHGWSDGWASLQVFGAPFEGGPWTEVHSAVLSNPVNQDVEAGAIEFAPPFEGRFVFIIGPVMNAEIEYLLRVDCVEGCEL